MQTADLSRPLTIAAIILLSASTASICRAQLITPTGVWLEADTGVSVSSGTAVASWTDQVNSSALNSVTGSGVSLVADGTSVGLPANKPVISFSNDPVLDLNNLPSSPANFLRSGSIGANLITLQNQSTVFIVERPLTSLSQTPFAWKSGGNVWLGSSDFNNTIIFADGNLGAGGQVATATPGGWFGNWHVLTLQRNGTSGSIQVDNNTAVNLSFSDGGTGINVTAPATGTLDVGGDHFSGDVAAVLVYKGVLDSTQIGQVQTYLNDKYFTAVPEPSQYAVAFALACLGGAVLLRQRRQAVRPS